MQISKDNVGRIAERIVANELEARGFRVSDLNSDGTAANSDLLAVSPDLTLQVQVKGSANAADEPWWVGYGHCTVPIIEKQNNASMFNRRSSFYKATHVVLVAIRSPREYCCIVLPVDVAEQAAQLNLNREYRTPKRNGEKKAPNKVFIALEPLPNAQTRTIEACKEERGILASHRDEKGWERLSVQTRPMNDTRITGPRKKSRQPSRRKIVLKPQKKLRRRYSEREILMSRMVLAAIKKARVRTRLPSATIEPSAMFIQRTALETRRVVAELRPSADKPASLLISRACPGG